MVALDEVGFLFSEKPRCPLVNLVGDDISAPVNQPFAYASRNLFGDGTSTPIYRPLDVDAWPKSKNGKKICCLNTFKLSIM